MNPEARVQTTDPDLNLRLALAGVGLTILYERSVRPHIEAGRIVGGLPPLGSRHCREHLEQAPAGGFPRGLNT